MKKEPLGTVEKRKKFSRKTWKIMKLCGIFCFVLSLNLSANVYSQQNKVSLDLKEVTLEEFIEAVKQQTGVNFLYNASLFEGAEKVSVKAKKEPLSKVLEETLGQKGYAIDYRDEVVVILKQEPQPFVPQVNKRTVSGTVRDADGEPVPGVSVLVKGTQVGVATDVNGRFELRVDDNPEVVLQFSFVGMKSQEVKIGTHTTLNVVLESDTKALDEVLVTGYQTISKERATGSFDMVSRAQLDKPASSLASRLVGVTAGVQGTADENGDISFEIRGQTSLNTDARPLVVVDGFPIEGEFSSINPNDVESVTILKDAAAASIWGARSANGVIVVTTKKGAATKGAKIEVSAFAKVQRKIDLDYYNPLASSAETVEYERKGFSTNFFGGPWSPLDDSYLNAQSGYSQAVVALNENRLGYLSDEDLEATLEKLSNQNNKDQIRKYLLQIPLTHQYNVNISGATERMTNMLSLMYERERDGFKENHEDHLMVNFRNTTKLFKWLDFNFSGMVQYNSVDNSGINATGDYYSLTYGSIQELSPYDMLVDENGNRTNLAGTFYQPILDRYVPTENFPYTDWSYNPITEIENRELGYTQMNYRVQGGFTVRFLEGLTYDTKFQYERYNTHYTDIYNENTFAVRQHINTTSTWDKETNEITANLPKGGIKDESDETIQSYNFRNQINFDRTFKGRHALNVIIGTEISQRIEETTDYARTYGYNDETLSVGVFPNGESGTIGWMGWSNGTFDYTNSYTYTTDRYFSLYANAAYTLDEKYTLSGSVRTDASNLITDDPKYRYAPFWSVGLGWQISKENFMQDIAWIDRLNIRATYGYNGNVDKSTSFRPLISVNSTQNTYTHDFTASIQSYGNPDLRWERTGTWDVGIDYSFLGGKLAGKVDIYSKLGKDLMASMSIPSVNGTSTQSLNAAKMTNRGIELEVGTQLPVYGDKIVWTGNLNFSYNKNKIQELYKATYQAYELYGGGTSAYVEGYDANTLWVFEYAGIENRGSVENPDWQPVVKGANGETYDFTGWTPGNGLDYLKNAGTKVAPYAFGFSNSFKIYNFDLSFLITGKFGHKFMRTGFNYPSMSGGSALPNKYYSEVANSDPMDMVPIPFDKAEPRYYFWDRFYPYLDYLVESAAHIRLQEVNISYNMPKRWLEKIGINSLSVYAQGNNLCTWLKNKYKEDPEHPLGTLPLQATYTFGLRFDF